jgi:uncharacterized membrane protein YkvA (DUF1232 family)
MTNHGQMGDEAMAADPHMTAEFDDQGFWSKVTGVVRSAGEAAVTQVFKAYFVAQADTTPAWAKTALYSALVYFVLPIDAVPDAIPVIGFSDDVAALGAALVSTQAHATEETDEQARAATRRLFGG